MNQTSLATADLVHSPGATPVTLDFPAGQIICLAGLDGQGQERFLETLAGWNRPASGGVFTPGAKGAEKLRGGRHAHRLGVAFLPRDRRENGIFPSQSILDNFAISSSARDSFFGLISQKQRNERFAHYQQLLGIVADNPRNPITSLSGGNQQKVLVARLLASEPRVLLLNDPTRGVDVATRTMLYQLFRDLAAKGMTLVIVSTEIEEAINLADRVIVFRDQDISVELSGNDKTNARVLAGMFGEAA
ncbi:ATP-binding cassette domain-containing protein [Hoeflea ulvae]|uniref:ATP-binding cassette domain-containing protein n=1 Tax=Hoeflea ulvae TaxID=2983764 RepID=A0ABT3YKA9_9HYPH|nr:ATP-binding cassette domain-containing protein [Hoeflea ulvae]MCY0096334.1 ATP-binding cassette domain-containing protein [Hoeflea ulvae]